jgi:hypothetical protein
MRPLFLGHRPQLLLDDMRRLGLSAAPGASADTPMLATAAGAA